MKQLFLLEIMFIYNSFATALENVILTGFLLIMRIFFVFEYVNFYGHFQKFTVSRDFGHNVFVLTKTMTFPITSYPEMLREGIPQL